MDALNKNWPPALSTADATLLRIIEDVKNPPKHVQEVARFDYKVKLSEVGTREQINRMANK